MDSPLVSCWLAHSSSYEIFPHDDGLERQHAPPQDECVSRWMGARSWRHSSTWERALSTCTWALSALPETAQVMFFMHGACACDQAVLMTLSLCT